MPLLTSIILTRALWGRFGTQPDVPIYPSSPASPSKFIAYLFLAQSFFFGGRQKIPLSETESFKGREKVCLSKTETFFKIGTRIIHSYGRKYRYEKFIRKPHFPTPELHCSSLFLTSSRLRKPLFLGETV